MFRLRPRCLLLTVCLGILYSQSGINGQTTTVATTTTTAPTTATTTVATGTVATDATQQTVSATFAPMDATKTVTETATQNADPCVDNILRQIYDQLAKNYPQFNNLTMNLVQPRETYRFLMNNSFNMEQLQSYCKAYQMLYTPLESCPESQPKTLSINQLGLATYVCITNQAAYTEAIPCIQKINNDAKMPACREQCAQYSPMATAYETHGYDATNEMEVIGGDCQYMQCIGTCRVPLITATCGEKMTNLEMDAMTTAVQYTERLYEPEGMSEGQSSFPQQCRDVIGQTSQTGSTSMPDNAANASGTTVMPSANSNTVTVHPDNGVGASQLSMLLSLMTASVVLVSFFKF